MKAVFSIVTAAAVALLFSAALAGSDQSAGDEAVEEARSWLAAVDEGRYGESWSMAAGFFRKAVEEAEWQRSMNAFRKPLGALVERRLRSVQHVTTLPGAPDGEYVVVVFDTSFTHKKAAVETVTPMLEADGEWRVSGYFIQ